MPRYLVERSFTDGLHIPVNAIGAKTCAEVVGTNHRCPRSRLRPIQHRVDARCR